MIRHIHSLAHPVFNESGELTEYVGTVIDTTEQHQARAALAQAFEEIDTLKERLHHENVALREEIERTSMFEEIVGSSTGCARGSFACWPRSLQWTPRFSSRGRRAQAKS